MYENRFCSCSQQKETGNKIIIKNVDRRAITTVAAAASKGRVQQPSRVGRERVEVFFLGFENKQFYRKEKRIVVDDIYIYMYIVRVVGWYRRETKKYRKSKSNNLSVYLSTYNNPYMSLNHHKYILRQTALFLFLLSCSQEKMQQQKRSNTRQRERERNCEKTLRHLKPRYRINKYDR